MTKHANTKPAATKRPGKPGPTVTPPVAPVPPVAYVPSEAFALAIARIAGDHRVSVGGSFYAERYRAAAANEAFDLAAAHKFAQSHGLAVAKSTVSKWATAYGHAAAALRFTGAADAPSAAVVEAFGMILAAGGHGVSAARMDSIVESARKGTTVAKRSAILADAIQSAREAAASKGKSDGGAGKPRSAGGADATGAATARPTADAVAPAEMTGAEMIAALDAIAAAVQSGALSDDDTAMIAAGVDMIAAAIERAVA